MQEFKEAERPAPSCSTQQEAVTNLQAVSALMTHLTYKCRVMA